MDALVWQALVPLHVSLCPHDAAILATSTSTPTTTNAAHTQSQSPSPSENSNADSVATTVIMAPRASWLPLLATELRKHFIETADLRFVGDDGDVWFDWRGTSLKWHYPLGLLYDLACATASESTSASEPDTDRVLSNTPLLPFCITLHFLNYPTDSLLRIPASTTLDAPRDLYTHAVKEAVYLVYGHGRKLSSISRANLNSLWESVSSRKYDRWWNVWSSLIDAYNPNTDPTTAIKHIPLKLYTSYTHPVKMSLVPPRTSTGSQTLVGNLLLPHDTTSSISSSEDLAPTPGNCKILTHGIYIPPSTPLIWLWMNMCYPDGYLHLVIVPSPPSPANTSSITQQPINQS